MLRMIALAPVLFLALPLFGDGVKIAGVEFVPKDLIFAAPETKSRASAEGPLENECKWSFGSETRIGRREELQTCIRFYYKTTVTLTQSCPPPKQDTVVRTSDRITTIEPRCPDANGRITSPSSDAKALSSGHTADGRHQDIVLQPDGTRIVLSYTEKGVVVAIAYPDGSGDTLQLPPPK